MWDRLITSYFNVGSSLKNCVRFLLEASNEDHMLFGRKDLEEEKKGSVRKFVSYQYLI